MTIDKIVCPRCGANGETPANDLHNVDPEKGQNVSFYLLEDITVFREIFGIKDGKLQVCGLPHSGEGYDDGRPGTLRLECRHCLHEFAVPEGFSEGEHVDYNADRCGNNTFYS